MKNCSIVREETEVQWTRVGLNAGYKTPCGEYPITIATSGEHVHTAEEAERIAKTLLTLAAKVRREEQEKARTIRAEEIVDGAVFYASGLYWRKVIELHPGRFMLVSNTGADVSLDTLASAGERAAYMTSEGYTREKAA